MPLEVFGPPPTEAHLWWAHVSLLDDPDVVAACQALLLPEELQAMQRFVFLHSRNEYLLTRALCRRVLSHYSSVPPMDWQFARNAHGRPDIAAPRLTPRLHFNLSNTRGMAICLVAQDVELGVDVEWLKRPRGTVDVARSVFSPAEYADYSACDPSQELRRFYSYWTLKESYIKARGIGLSLGLEKFTMHLGGDTIGVSFDPSLQDSPSAWQFALIELRDEYLAAVALQRGTRANFHIKTYAGLPPQK